MPRPSLEIINQVISPESASSLPFATGNINKQQEIAALLQLPLEQVEFVSLDIEEIQSDNPEVVVSAKARAAYEANHHQPVIVEDTSLNIPAINYLLPPTFVKYWASDRQKRDQVCNMVPANRPEAYAQVLLAVFDGTEVHIRRGVTSGTIAEIPIGNDNFGWDDIFIPDSGDGRTYAQMNLVEKNKTAPRAKAFQALTTEPFDIGKYIFRVPEPYPFQTEAINLPELHLSEQSRAYAQQLRILQGVEVSPSLEVETSQLPPFYQTELVANTGFYTVGLNPDPTIDPSLGLIHTPMDRAVDLNGEPYRLALGSDQMPIFWQMGPEAIKMALAARIEEFNIHHNPEMYTYLREMMAANKLGDRIVPQRANKRSELIEHIIGLRKKGQPVAFNEFEEIFDAHEAGADLIESYEQFLAEYTIDYAATVEQVGYGRQYSADRQMSRTQTARSGLITDASGIPSSLFGLGGMPGVSGSVDTVATAALSYMDSYISANSIFSGNFQRRMNLFRQAKENIISLGLPDDIASLCVSHLGMAFGSGDIKNLEKEVAAFVAEGGKLVRMYTTNPDLRKTQAIEGMRQAGGEDIRICVGPIVDLEEAYALTQPNIRANILLPGHGGGENCTSIDDGNGAYTALELQYAMSLIPEFNYLSIGSEGGMGTAFGAVLGFVDLISLNRRGIGGGIEATGGLYYQHTNGRLVIHYPGSASVPTQWIEALVNPSVRSQRLDPAARLRNVEGRMNFMTKPRSINSIVDAWYLARMVAGRVLADQRSQSIAQLRQIIASEGYTNHRGVSTSARNTAKSHTSN